MCCLLAAGACESPSTKSSVSLLGTQDEHTAATATDGVSLLQPATGYPGSNESDRAFEYVGSTHEWGSYLVVADVRACQVVLLDWVSRQEASRYGRCGDGPGEFRQPFLLSSFGDSLVVVDVGRHELVFVGPGMAGERRMQLPMLARHDISGIEAIGPVDSDHLGLIVTWATGDPALRRQTPMRFIISASTGTVVDSGLFAPTALASQRLEVPVRITACFGQDSIGPWHAVQNSWMHEVLLFRGRDSLVWRHHDPRFTWIGTRVPENPRGGTGALAPSAHLPEMACTNSQVLARYAEIDWNNEALPLIRGLIQVLPTDGSGGATELVGAEAYDLFYSGTGGVTAEGTFILRHMAGRTGILLAATPARARVQ